MDKKTYKVLRQAGIPTDRERMIADLKDWRTYKIPLFILLFIPAVMVAGLIVDGMRWVAALLGLS